MEIICNQETLILSPSRALYWPRRRLLLLADLHLGKTGYFRASGIPIPSSVMQQDLQRLSALINEFQPETIIVAGDMFHHDYNSDIAIFNKWRQPYSDIPWLLVPGNHDKLLDIDYQQLGIRVTDTVYEELPFNIVHEPSEQPAGFELSGHLHPGYRLEGRARQQLRLPCFIVSEQRIILPAFSGFTGLYTSYRIRENCSYYLVVDDQVLPAF
ncbi:ligase-associated DNA damage response endonuclease PdeM [Niabella terrae]